MVVKQYRDKRIRRHARIRREVIGSAARPRLAVFRSDRHIYCQAIDDAAGHTLAAASDHDLKTKSSNKAIAEQVGRLVAERSLKQGITAVVFDRGGYRYHGRVQSLAEGARAGGLKF